MQPLISIITPVYNAEKYIRQCIESVVSQSYQRWELILIDDCSKDSSVCIISEYLSDSRIKLFKNEKNLGPALTRNIGLDNTKGDYIAFLDSDDFWSEKRLENQLRFMVDNNIQISHGKYYLCDSESAILKEVRVDYKIDYALLLKGNQFKPTTMMLAKSLIIDNKFENIRHEDYAFFLECLKNTNYSLANLSNTDSFYRIGQGISSNKYRSAIWTWNIYRKYLKLGMIESLYYFVHYAISGFIKYKR